jgi:hypothetical protein
MRNTLALAFFVAATPAMAANGIDLGPGQKLLAPITHKNLAVFPVVLADKAPDGVRYLSLTEGMKAGMVAVQEQKTGATVNAVNVANNSDRPLLLLGGEVILGGQQDRIIGEDTIIQPHAELRVPVFCVEHGRWSGRGQFTSTGGIADAKVRVQAKIAGSQQAVWDEVAKKTKALKAETSTGTYRTLATGEQGKVATQPFREAIAPKLAALPEAGRVIGLVAAVNGRVTSVDIFADPQLFSTYRERLLDSIFLAVADQPVTSIAAPEPAKVSEFVNEVRAAKPASVKRDKNNNENEIKKGKKAVGTSLKESGGKALYDSFQAVD